MARSKHLHWMLVAAILMTTASAANAGHPRQAEDAALVKSIGTATEEADGTIVLDLRATGAGGAIGDGRLRYPRTHPQYAMIRAHIGPIPKGGSVPVKPFPPA